MFDEYSLRVVHHSFTESASLKLYFGSHTWK